MNDIIPPLNIDGFDPLPLDLQGWQSFCPIFERLIVKKRPNVIVEVGSWKGASAINMANICKKHSIPATIYCVDTWLGAKEFWTHPTPERDLKLRNGFPQVYYQFLSNVIRMGHHDMIRPVPVPSSIGLEIVPSPDLIYIDGDHSYDGVLADFSKAIKVGKRECIIFGDDYCNGAFHVKQAVDDVAAREDYVIQFESRDPARNPGEKWFWILE